MLGNKDYWQKAGEYFGYPQCCIDDFIRRCETEKYSITKEQEFVNSGHGFVPCHNCACKLIEDKKATASLIVNRIHPEPFPYDTFKLFEKYMIALGF